MVDMKRKQPVVSDFLRADDYKLIAQWQADIILQSVSCMHEILVQKD